MPPNFLYFEIYSQIIRSLILSMSLKIFKPENFTPQLLLFKNQKNNILFSIVKTQKMTNLPLDTLINTLIVASFFFFPRVVKGKRAATPVERERGGGQ